MRIRLIFFVLARRQTDSSFAKEWPQSTLYNRSIILEDAPAADATTPSKVSEASARPTKVEDSE